MHFFVEMLLIQHTYISCVLIFRFLFPLSYLLDSKKMTRSLLIDEILTIYCFVQVIICIKGKGPVHICILMLNIEMNFIFKKVRPK